MALLESSFAVVLVVHADDAEVGWIQHGNGGECADVHQQFAIAGDYQDATTRLREREAQSHRHRPTHGAAHREHGRAVRTGRCEHVVLCASEAGDDKEFAAIANKSCDGLSSIQAMRLRGGCRGRRLGHVIAREMC